MLVDCVDGLATEKFYTNFLEPGIPVVIRQGCSRWGACQWTFNSLKETIGHHLVDVRTRTNQAEYKVGRKYGLESILVRKYLEDLLEENEVSKGRYLAVQPILRTFPSLAADVTPLPCWVGKIHSGPHLWIGSQGHYEFTHYDPDDGMLVMIQGQKRVRLISPRHLHAMYPNPLGSLGRTIQSQVDLEAKDLATNFPQFQPEFVQETILGPGDCLFIPFGWWHQVTSLTPSISVNMFWGPSGEHEFLDRVLFTQAERWQAFQYWFRNILTQNEKHENTHKWLARTSEVLSQFLYRQFKETATIKHLGLLEKEVLEFFGLKERPPSDPNDRQKYPPLLKIRGLKVRVNGALASSKSSGAPSGKKVCLSFRDTGLCKWGENCKFSHRMPVETISYYGVSVKLEQDPQTTVPEV